MNQTMQKLIKHMLTSYLYGTANLLDQGFPTFYIRCPPKTKISNVASPQEEVVPPLEGLNDF